MALIPYGTLSLSLLQGTGIIISADNVGTYAPTKVNIMHVRIRYHLYFQLFNIIFLLLK